VSAPAVSRAYAVVAVSGWLLERLRSSGLVPPRPHVINMGVDLARFTPGPREEARRRLDLDRRDTLLLAVGGLTARKNPLGLLQALGHVRRQRPDVRLVLVGAGPLASAVTVGAERLGLGGAVQLVPAVEHAEVPHWLRAADALVLPSLAEPLGQVVLESLACGRPVVATREGGPAEILPPEVGALVDPRDPGSIADGILDVLARAPGPERCRRAAERHGLDRQAARVDVLLREAAAAGRR
jgi:glycosyltransferase involved in cell wall biosynthesis